MTSTTVAEVSVCFCCCRASSSGSPGRREVVSVACFVWGKSSALSGPDFNDRDTDNVLLTEFGFSSLLRVTFYAKEKRSQY